MLAANPPATAGSVAPQSTVFPILISLSFCHLLNDLMQSLIPALYPMLKSQLHLDFAQIGLITLAFQLTASLLQPTVGLVSGMFFGFAFGLGGLGAAAMGGIADAHGIAFVYQLCSYLPAIGLVAWLLPNLAHERQPLAS